MDSTCHECGEPQTVWMAARCSNPSKTVTCGEVFCFKCLSQKYPQIYGSIFKGLWWLCPVCLGMCKCETCSDPVKKAEYQRMAKRKLKQMKQRQMPVEDTKPKLRSGHKMVRPPILAPEIPPPLLPPVEEPDNMWICSRCSTVNNLDEIECLTCGSHRRRNTRKRAAPEPLHEDKYHAYKETKRASENGEDKPIPAKGRVVALRQLVKRPWSDGWELGRKLALDLIEEAKQQAIKQRQPVDQIRQLPTKCMLANNRNTHVRKWYDREPTLAKKFLRAAGLVCSKSNGTFIKDHFRSIEELPPLIRKIDPAKLVDYEGDSGDEADGETMTSMSEPQSPVDLSPPQSPLPIYQPKLKVYYHSPEASPSGEEHPFVFKVPISDLGTMDELHSRLNDLLMEMGTEKSEKKLILRIAYDNNAHVPSDECKSLDDLSNCSLLHVHAA